MVKHVGIVAIVAAVIVAVLSTNIPDETSKGRPLRCEHNINHISTGAAGRIHFNADAKSYIYKSSGYTVNAPYRYRVVLPWLTKYAGKIIPQPVEAMLAVSMVALWAFYVIAGLTCFYLGIGILPTLAGLIGIQTFWHLYIYINPWTPDSIQFLCASILILALVKRNYSVYLMMVVIGILNKEAFLFIVPAWFITRQWTKAGIATALGLSVFILPRLSTWEIYSTVANQYSAWSLGHMIHHPQQALATVILAWGLIWYISAKGAVKNKEMLFVWILMFAGALIACLGAGDYGRMMASMTPIMFISIALFFHTEVTK